MHEFRPAEVVEADNRLAESLVRGDPDALDALVARYGRAVHAVTTDADDASDHDRTADVFVDAWNDRARLAAGSDFAPWIGTLAAARTGRRVEEIDDTWAVAMAVDGIAPEHRSSLRTHHLERVALPEAAGRAERRLRSRLAHLGDDETITDALTAPTVWGDPDPDLATRVRSRSGLADPPPQNAASTSPGVGDGHDAGADHDQSAAGPGLVARSLRPVLLGLGGAVVVLFVAIVALSAASGSPVPATFTAEMTPTGAIAEVEGGELTATELDSGLRLDLEAPTLPRRVGDQFYTGVLVLADGSELAVGSFNTGFDVTLTAGIPLDRVVEFRVETGTLDGDAGDVVLKLDVPQS